MAVSNLHNEVVKFNKNCRYLRRILKDTLFYLDEINKEHFVNKDQCQQLGESNTELRDIESVLDRPPAFFVFGQSRIAKAYVVNEILGRQLFELSLSSHEAVTQVKILVIKQDHKSTSGSCDELSNTPITWEELVIEGNVDDKDVTITKEILLAHPLFRDDVKMYVIPELNGKISNAVVELVRNSSPIFIYAAKAPMLQDPEHEELREMQRFFSQIPVFLVSSIWFPSELAESDQDQWVQNFDWPCGRLAQVYVDLRRRSNTGSDRNRTARFSPMDYLLVKQVTDLGYQLPLPGTRLNQGSSGNSYSHVCVGLENLPSLNTFSRRQFQSRFVKCSSVLVEVHARCLRLFVLSAFDVARSMQITPRRIQFAKRQEAELYKNLMNLTTEKHDEVRSMIVDTLTSKREELIEMARNQNFPGVDDSEDSGFEEDHHMSSQDVEKHTDIIQKLVIGALNKAVASQLVDSVDLFRKSVIGTLQRCVEALEEDDEEGGHRALDSLKQILNAAYQVQLSLRASTSFVQTFFKQLIQLFAQIVLPWNAPPKPDQEWRAEVAADTLDSLNPTRMAKVICDQVGDKAKNKDSGA